MNQKVIQKLLLNIGFSHITVVDNGLKAIDKVTNTNFDLVLMDVMVCDFSQNFFRKNMKKF